MIVQEKWLLLSFLHRQHSKGHPSSPATATLFHTLLPGHQQPPRAQSKVRARAWVRFLTRFPSSTPALRARERTGRQACERPHQTARPRPGASGRTKRGPLFLIEQKCERCGACRLVGPGKRCLRGLAAPGATFRIAFPVALPTPPRWLCHPIPRSKCFLQLFVIHLRS